MDTDIEERVFMKKLLTIAGTAAVLALGAFGVSRLIKSRAA